MLAALEPLVLRFVAGAVEARDRQKGGISVPKKPRPVLKKDEKKEGHKKEKREI